MRAKTANQKEEIRHAVRSVLYDRQRTAHPAASVLRHLRAAGYDADLEDAEAALGFLEQLGIVSCQPDPLGSTRYYQLNAEGILAHERADEI
jgi:hypothetical protein